MSGDEILKMLNNVDLSDPAQANSAIGIVDTLINGVETSTAFDNKYDTTTKIISTSIEEGIDDGSSTTPSSTVPISTTTSSVKNEAEEAEKIYSLLKVAMSLTDTSGLAPTLTAADFEIRFVII